MVCALRDLAIFCFKLKRITEKCMRLNAYIHNPTKTCQDPFTPLLELEWCVDFSKYHKVKSLKVHCNIIIIMHINHIYIHMYNNCKKCQMYSQLNLTKCDRFILLRRCLHSSRHFYNISCIYNWMAWWI